MMVVAMVTVVMVSDCDIIIIIIMRIPNYEEVECI